MVRLFAKTLLIYCLALGILLPQASAVLASLGLSSARIAIICTGEGLRTISLDASGEPAPLSEDPGYCALVSALDTSDDTPAATAPLKLLFATTPITHSHQAAIQQAQKQSLPRAPPAL